MRRRLLAWIFLLTIAGSAPAAIPAHQAAARHPAPRLIEPLAGAGVAAPTPPPQSVRVGFRVKVPQLGIDLPVVEGEGGASEPPLNVAAHYPGMKWPGEGGRSFLYAHARDGMFGPLFHAAVGQEVDIAAPNGSTLRYAIRQYFGAWPVMDVSILNPTDHEELVLYTCTSWTYSDPKIVAIAVPIG